MSVDCVSAAVRGWLRIFYNVYSMGLTGLPWTRAWCKSQSHEPRL